MVEKWTILSGIFGIVIGALVISLFYYIIDHGYSTLKSRERWVIKNFCKRCNGHLSNFYGDYRDEVCQSCGEILLDENFIYIKNHIRLPASMNLVGFQKQSLAENQCLQNRKERKTED